MSTSTPSRNPFADPNGLTFADLIHRVRDEALVPLRTRQNWIWALRTVARASAREPSAMPAHPAFLREVWKRATPAAIGISPGAWNNARSLCGKVLEWAGLASVPGHYQAPFSPPWAALWAKLPRDSAMTHQLGRLLHYASAQDIFPEAISEAVLTAFYSAMTAESIVKDPFEVWRGAAKTWNNAAAQIAGWPQIRLPVPSKRSARFSKSWTDFPSSLEADVALYCRRAAGLDLSDDAFRKAQRPQTIETRRKQLLYFASALVHVGEAPRDLTDLAALLRPDRAVRGLQFLVDRRGTKTYAMLSNLANFLPTLARRIALPSETVAKLRHYANRLKMDHTGIAERHRATLHAFNDVAAVSALLNLPQRIVLQVEHSGRVGFREAKLIQTALAIEFLIMAPVRVGNLSAIEIKRHFVEVGREPKVVHLLFPRAEVKNSVDLEFPLPAETLELLALYISKYRPLLHDGQSRFLFPGKIAGMHKGGNHLSQQIQAAVYAHTRIEMPAHRFRHAIAKIYLDRNPGQYETVRQFLGHRNVETTIAFYAGNETASAARHYAATILGIRDGSANGVKNV